MRQGKIVTEILTDDEPLLLWQVIGVTEKTGEEVVIRTCSIENMDNQCGTFKFEDEMVRGCILTCNYDGCNHGITPTGHSIGLLLGLSLLIGLLQLIN